MTQIAPAPDASSTRIDRSRLDAHLNPAVRRWTIECVEQTGSTNADLLARLREQPDTDVPCVRLAYAQSAGRGQRGRRWVDAPGSSLMFSLACRMPGDLSRLAGLSLATGVALLDGLQQLPLAAPQRLALKWPNDVLLSGRKLAGILIESSGGASSSGGNASTGIVIGIGLNLRHADALAVQLPGSSSHPAPTPPGALEDILPNPNMTLIFAALLNALDAMLEKFAVEGFSPFRADWEALHAFAGQPVRLLERETEVAYGVALGVDAQGRLRLNTDEGERLIASGEVSLRAGVPA